MILTSIVEQQERMNPGAEPYGYPRRFNLLDMIGIGHDLSPVSPRPDKSGPPEGDRYDNPIFDHCHPAALRRRCCAQSITGGYQRDRARVHHMNDATKTPSQSFTPTSDSKSRRKLLEVIEHCPEQPFS